jgi:TusA-related sulfurtransferase
MSDRKNDNPSFEIIETVKKEDIPGWSTSSKYDPLLKSLATLESGEVLKIRVEKMTMVTAIRKAVNKNFTHSKFKIRQRQHPRGNYCYIEKL